MSRFKELGRTDCRFYREQSCYALKVFDCRLGNDCKFYQPETGVVSKKGASGINIRYYANTDNLKKLMNAHKVKSIDIATTLYIHPDNMSKKLNARRAFHAHEVEKICELLEISDIDFMKYFRVEERNSKAAKNRFRDY